MIQETINSLIFVGVPTLGVVIVCIVASVIFRTSIMGVINRITGVSRDGLTAPHQQATPPPGSEEEGESEEKKGASNPDHLRAFDNTLIVTHELAILNDSSFAQETDPKRREEILLRHLAATQIREHFERTYREIWGAQLKALQHLVGSSASVNKSFVKPFYDEGSASSPLSYSLMDFDQWLNFLVSTRLITLTNDEIAITVAGREFLKYLIDRGYSAIKAR